jgi:hypothetical protein
LRAGGVADPPRAAGRHVRTGSWTGPPRGERAPHSYPWSHCFGGGPVQDPVFTRYTCPGGGAGSPHGCGQAQGCPTAVNSEGSSFLPADFQTDSGLLSLQEFLSSPMRGVQGYLAHKKRRPPRTLQ